MPSLAPGARRAAPRPRSALALIALLAIGAQAAAPGASLSYAERLGWPAGTRVLILHVDDAGMSLDSNRGTIRAIEDGIATSLSVMMPTPWVPHIVAWIREHPRHDAGLHLTLTSEWDNYRWEPLTGRRAAGLIDSEGAFWPTVEQVVANASADEVAAEIRAQLERARAMGFEPTHLDSHMGTLFAHPDFLARYLELGMAEGIPVMFPAGHNYFITRQNPQATTLGHVGEQLWAAGLPVLDDLHNYSYGWARQDKTDNYVDAVRQLRPGVTMMILHATEPTEVFASISDSGPSRLGDLEAMLDPRLAAAIRDEGIVLTTWRELMRRRQAVGDGCHTCGR
ncbi:MAG: polysaccharide deacetylase family protein [Pseudomonadales bacterium]